MPLPRRALAAYQPAERHVLVDASTTCKLITLRRPEALNALHDQMTDEILGVIRRHEDDPASAGFVIVGYGTKAFCAGADIGRFPSLLGDADAAAQYARDCSRLLVHLDNMRKPVVAALNGMALGGGFELAMRCHGSVALRERVDAASRNHARHRARHRGDGRAVPPLARPRQPFSTPCWRGPSR